MFLTPFGYGRKKAIRSWGLLLSLLSPALFNLRGGVEMKTITKIFIGVALVACTGCYAGMATFNDAPGLLYSDIKGPRDAEGPIGPKQGEACSTSILGLVSTGDSSVVAAAAAGGVRNVTTVDRSSHNILGIYAQYCTEVHGN